MLCHKLVSKLQGLLFSGRCKTEDAMENLLYLSEMLPSFRSLRLEFEDASKQPTALLQPTLTLLRIAQNRPAE